MTNYRCGECGVEGVAGQAEHKAGCSRIESSSVGDEVRMAFVGETKAVNAETRTVDHVISTKTIDRMNDVVEPLGWDFKDYMKNPVVLADHSYSIHSIIGKNLELRKNRLGVQAKTEFHDFGLGAHAFNLVEAGMVKGWSVGFRGIEEHSISDGIKGKCAVCKSTHKTLLGGRDPETVWIYGKHFLSQKLLEYSLVAIPANPDTVTQALQKGLVDENSAQFLFCNPKTGEHPFTPSDQGMFYEAVMSKFKDLQIGTAHIMNRLTDLQAKLDDFDLDILRANIDALSESTKTIFTASHSEADEEKEEEKPTDRQVAAEPKAISDPEPASDEEAKPTSFPVDRTARMDGLINLANALRRDTRAHTIKGALPKGTK